MPPSWDIVVNTLRYPSINEAELADKIERLYCDHKQKEKEIDERKEQSDSGSYHSSMLEDLTLFFIFLPRYHLTVG